MVHFTADHPELHAAKPARAITDAAAPMLSARALPEPTSTFAWAMRLLCMSSALRRPPSCMVRRLLWPSKLARGPSSSARASASSELYAAQRQYTAGSSSARARPAAGSIAVLARSIDQEPTAWESARGAKYHRLGSGSHACAWRHSHLKSAVNQYMCDTPGVRSCTSVCDCALRPGSPDAAGVITRDVTYGRKSRQWRESSTRGTALPRARWRAPSLALAAPPFWDSGSGVSTKASSRSPRAPLTPPPLPRLPPPPPSASGARMVMRCTALPWPSRPKERVAVAATLP